MKKINFLLILFILLLFGSVLATTFTYSPKTWYTTNPSFAVIESEKNCGVSSDNSNDGWSAPQNICYNNTQLTICSNGCSGNYIVVKPNTPTQKQLSTLTSVKLKVYFTPRGSSHAGETASVGLRVNNTNYGDSFDITNASPKLIDITSKKNWIWSDLANSKMYLKLNNSVNLDIDYIELIITGDSCTSTETICDGIDNDCDGTTDEGVLKNFYKDFDTDTFGNNFEKILACTSPPGYVLDNNADCNDTNPNVKPGVNEICDGIDNDCTNGIDVNPTLGIECQKNSTNCTNTCTYQERNSTTTCNGTLPTNTIINSPNQTLTQGEKYNGTTWQPFGQTSYYFDLTQNYCAYNCETNYNYIQGQGCVANTQQATCTNPLPTNATWNSGQTNTYYYLGTNPNKTTHFSITQEDCAFVCQQDYHVDGNICVSNTKQLICSGSLPINAKWNLTNTFTQNYTNANWIPLSKNSFFDYTYQECSYSCLKESEPCELDKTTYCGTGTRDCNQGGWSECSVGTNARVCSQNQYCSSDTNDCLFCTGQTRNCDLNLLNSCETNILNDTNNCGTCGNICSTGFCTNGTCSDTNINTTTDPCDNITCEQNQTCISGSCSCDLGKYDCDNSNTNGCESNIVCQTPPECTYNFDCELNQTCSGGECISNQNTNSCERSTDCVNDEYCKDGYCELLICDNGFDLENHACVCDGAACGNTCYSTKGKCCNEIWNNEIKSCNYDLDQISNVVLISNDLEAEDLLTDAEKSINSGNVVKGILQAKLAELKANIKTGKVSQDSITIYEDALVAVEDGDYEEAQLLIEDIKELPPQDFTIFIIIGVIVLIGIGIFIYKNKFMNKNKPLDDY
ncbi:MAG: putative metal-binding motif-containing protein [archaeon]|jgi:hypothetical protein